MGEQCPCCQRPFEKMLDYPLVFVRRVEILPIPEAMDFWSEEAAMARLERWRDKPPDQEMLLEGINRTPEVASAYQALQSYFYVLKERQDQEVSPKELAPPLEPHRDFRWAHPIPGTRLYVALSEKETQGDERVCEVVLYGQGANFGSAGGPTLQAFGAVAAIHYEGRLVGPCARNSD